VVLQHYGERDWSQVLAAWAVLNGQMVWVIAHIDKGKLGQIGFVGDSQLTLGFLIEDYIAHMEHHLRAIQSWVG
jgi:hypothetical protein